MAHIDLGNDLPGIRGPMAFRPQTARPLNEPAKQNVHGSLAQHYLECDMPYIDAVNFGATDREIHDTVLIAAAFCMYNRYVDGLATWAPQDRQFYVDRASRRAAKGYLDYDLHK